jgi:hypothetical protein
MTVIYAILALGGLFPLATAWHANRNTTLCHALLWCVAAWLAWAWAMLGAQTDEAGVDPSRYLALCLTGASGVAVLGARRPYAFAWNFVVLGLLAVMLLPLIESLVIGTSAVDPLRISFLSATLAVGLLNYLPTCFGPAVLLLAPALTMEVVALFVPMEVQFAHLLVLLAPWVVWGCWRGRRPATSEFAQLWLDFRNRLGLFWSQRVRDQFNNAAVHAGWPVDLRWRGLHRTGEREAIAPAEQEAMVQTLRKALQRFTMPENQ